MVFFCGAGISVPSGLPSFRVLVCRLYASLNMCPNPREQKAIDREEFDVALGLLESRVADKAMRSEAARLLSGSPKPDSLRLHRALLDVSRRPSGMHLVTTNYDDNFAHANGSDDLNVQTGPTLPDLDNWNSVVHLHGRIQSSAVEPEAPPLVLTDKDFGKAYLAEGWAAVFVSDLLARYTVVFVGYSMADVVVRYLANAVTSQRLGAHTYSLVGYRDEEQREQRELKWKELGIYPILYDSGNEHELLVGTVEEWAKLAADPLQYRVQLALSGLNRVPDRQTHEADPDRVVWALSDPAAAWPAFNRIRHTPVLGAHAAEWLREFAVRGLLGGTVQPKPFERGPAGPVLTVRVEQQLLQTDSVANAVALWIEIHAHSPEVFRWVIKHGRNIHFELRRRLWDRLISTDDDLPDIPPRLARLWTLLLAEPPDDAEFLLRLENILSNVSRENTEAADDILLRLLRPRLAVFAGPAPYRILSIDASTPEQLALLSCGHTDVVLGCRDEDLRFNVITEIEPRRFGHFLRRHAVSLTEYLKTAIALLQRSDRADVQFIYLQLSDAFGSDGPKMAHWSGDAERCTDGATIDAKWTNSERRRYLRDFVGTWAVLLDWVRVSYHALPEDGRERDDLLRFWVNSNEKMLWCIALEAIEQDRTADFNLVRVVLDRKAGEVLWDPDCQREVLSILRSVGTRASSELQINLVDAVQNRVGAGTPRLDSDGNILAEVGCRLAALQKGGVTLSPAAAQTLSTFERRQGAELRYEFQAEPVRLSGRIREVAAALRGESVDVAIFREFAQRRPVAAMLALQQLGHSGDWPTGMWKATLDIVRTKVRDTVSGHQRSARLVEILLGTPQDLFQGLQYEIAQMVDVLAERWPETDDSAFWRLWVRGWEHRSQQSGILSPIDALTHALNTTAGTYAGAAMKRIREGTSRTSGPVTSEQTSILDRISGDDSGSAGIVMLVFWLDWLYLNATDWTTQNVLPRMRWGRATTSDELSEVRALWGVVAFRGSVSPDLVRVLGSDLWTAVQRHAEVDSGEKLVRFFVYMSVSRKRGLIDESTCRETAHIVIRDNPWHVGVALGKVLDENDEPREQVWREFVRPWLHQYWPREKTLNTIGSSSALVEIIMATGDAFPDAVDWAGGFLLALDDRQISKVWYHKNTWRSHPRAAVDLLHRIVPEDSIDPWARASLADMLKMLREVDATISQDSKFVELERRAAR